MCCSWRRRPINTIAYSDDGINWSGLGKTIFTTRGNGIAWNGTRWVAVGEGTNKIAYSSDGKIWTGVPTSSASIFTEGYGVAGNPNIGTTIVDSVITLNSNILPNTNRLDIVSDSYYNTGYSNFSVNIIGESN
jgi:hypothetical protein